MFEHHKILSLEINGGFLQGTTFNFSDGLNCIIGGRGTGKTTALELIRFVLDRMPNRKTDKRPYHQKLQPLINNNLKNGTAAVTIATRDGATYKVTRSVGEPSSIVDSNGQETGFDISRDNVFGIEVYSQSEIEDIAGNPQSQLALLDKFADRRLQDVETKIKETLTELKNNGRQLTEARRREYSLQDKLHELPDLQERQRVLSTSSERVSSSVEDAHRQNGLRIREREAIDELIRANSKGKKHIEDVATSLASLSPRHCRHDKMPHAEAIVAAREVSDQAFSKARSEMAGASITFAQAQTELQQVKNRLATLHSDPNKEYHELIAKHDHDQKMGAERVQIEQRLVELDRVKSELDGTAKTRGELVVERNLLMARLSELRDARYRYREDAAQHLNSKLSPTIIVQVAQQANIRSYQAMLSRAMKGSGIQYNNIIERLVHRVPPQELAKIVYASDVQTLARELDLDSDRTANFISHLTDKPDMYDIETVELHDQPSLKLKDGEYKDSNELSTGQKCTVILPILLLESDRVLLIDQPEDNLDNAFIFDSVVRVLRTCKEHRQLIFVTHNPNIPVLGDAARVFCLHSTGLAASVLSSGNVDEVAEQIVATLEGGRDAFEARRKRYGDVTPAHTEEDI